MVQEHPQGSESDAELIEDELGEIKEDVIAQSAGERAENQGAADLDDEENAEAP